MKADAASSGRLPAGIQASPGMAETPSATPLRVSSTGPAGEEAARTMADLPRGAMGLIIKAQTFTIRAPTQEDKSEGGPKNKLIDV